MRLFFIIILCAFYLQGRSQTFIGKEKLWSILKIDDSFSPEHPSKTYETYFAKFIGDTLINGKLYDKLYHSYDSFLTWKPLALLREDSNRIYLWNKTQNSDLLLYNFNLEIGDTGFVASVQYNTVSNDSLFFKIDSIDNITLSGKKYKGLYVSLNYASNSDCKFPEIWISEIGSLTGPLRQACNCITPCYVSWNLLCMKNNDTLIYQNPNYNTCYYIDTTVNISSIKETESKIILYPNPSENFLYIKSELKNPKFIIIIYNLLGEKVKYFNVDQEKNNLLPVSDISNGIYFYEVVSKSRTINTGKIIIQRK